MTHARLSFLFASLLCFTLACQARDLTTKADPKPTEEPTTQSAAGATNFNSVGVKNFTSYEQGLAATVKTLTNGRYEPILAALRSGDSAVAVGRAVEASPWGTGGLMLRVLGAA